MMCSNIVSILLKYGVEIHVRSFISTEKQFDIQACSLTEPKGPISHSGRQLPTHALTTTKVFDSKVSAAKL